MFTSEQSPMRFTSSLWIACFLATWLGGTSFAQCHASIEVADAGREDNIPSSITSAAPQGGEEDRTVVVELVLRKSGAVHDATVTKGPATLRTAAIKAVRKHNYKNWMNDWPFQRDITVEVQFTRDMAAPPKIRRLMPGGVSSCVPAGQPMGYWPSPWSGVLPQSFNDLLRVQPIMPVLAPNGTKYGSVCVIPNSPEPPTRISPGGEYNPNTLTLRIDKQEPIRWPHKQVVLIDGLDLQTNHLGVLTSDGKRIQSLRFKFSEDDDAKLCIYFDGYQGVQLGNKKNADWCRVKVQDCWR